ncbi:MAG TPA: dienelactone hydrolase family protein [Burkholderiales bacterium]|nr:dienelactone hydrolase family protein [Burkholderiales bacterium]
MNDSLSNNQLSEFDSLLPNATFSRRGFIASTIAAGFALATHPLSAQTMIQTPTTGLEAGDTAIPVADGSIPGYYAVSSKSGKKPVILVIQEIFGVHEHIKDVCRRLANAGYFAVAPALFHRQGDVSQIKDIPTIQKEVVAKVPDAQVMSDLDATVAWARQHKHANTGKLGITGFCWGGRITWLYAAHNPNLDAGVAWYGRLIGDATANTPLHPVDIADQIKAPVLGLYGGADQGIPVDTVERMRAGLRAFVKPGEIIVYPDAPHAFNADYRPTYRKEVAEDAWAKMLAWFKKHGVA